MPVAIRFPMKPLSALARHALRRFATKTSRFRLAVSSGFVLVAVGTLVVGADMKIGAAQSFWGGMEFPGFGNDAPQAAPQQQPGPSGQYYSPRHHRVHLAHGGPGSPLHHVRFDKDKPLSLARKSICVRLCDGFVFPVGDYHGEGDRPAHEATCQSECPGAKTALFVVPLGSDSIGDATQVGSRRNYSELPDAFHYTTYLDETCSCHPTEGNRIKSLLRDFTLRRGDTVMTPKGLRVFHGGNSYPYKRKDFVALSKSHDIRNADRANLKAIERASLVQPTTVASSEPLTSDAHTDPSTKSLQHQAKN